MLPEILVFIFVLVLTKFLLADESDSGKGKRVPRVPRSLPLFGHLPLLGKHPHKTLLKWGDTHGPVYSIRFGSFPTIVLNSGEAIRKATGLLELAGRPYIKYWDLNSRNRAGFLFAHGKDVLETRSFVQKQLKGFGYGSKSMEDGIVDQIPEVIQIFEEKSKTGEPFTVKLLFSPNVIAYLYNILLGDEKKPEKSLLEYFSQVVSSVTTFTDALILGMFIPVLERFLPGIFGFNHITKNVHEVQQFFVDRVKEQNTTRVNSSPINLAQALLDRQDGMTNKDENYVPMCISELFGAGIETSSTTMEWMFYYYVKHPEVKSRIDQEIFQVLGKDRLPSTSDRPSMVYMEAFINEVLRKVTILPFAVYHYSMEDVQLEGYTIPKGWMVIPNLYAAHHDPKVWGDPQNFRPERFLDTTGKKLVKNPDMMAFGVGKRMCVGENLARNQLFLFFVSLIQKFDVTQAGPLPSEDGKFGLTLAADPFSVKVASRSA